MCSHISHRVQKFDKQYIDIINPNYWFTIHGIASFEQRENWWLWKRLRFQPTGAEAGLPQGCRLVELGGIPPRSPSLLYFCAVRSKQPQRYFCQVALQLILPGSQTVTSSTLPPPKCVSVQAAGPKLLETKLVEGLSGGKSVLEGVQGQLQCFVLRWVYLLSYQSRIE